MFRLLAVLLLHAVTSEGLSSRLTAGSSISGTQTLVSEGGGDFALGFFSPSNSSSNRYLGIWDNKIPGKSVVWVGNKETPLKDSVSGAVAIADDGNVAVSDANGTVIWSSGLPPSNATTYAVLLDTGNLVLKRATAANAGVDSVVWESFDHKSDTWLPNMDIWLDIKTGKSSKLFSWKSADDPSPGEFSMGIEPKSALQYKIWRRGSETFLRSDVWDGLSVEAGRQTATEAMVVQEMDFIDNKRLAYSFSLTKGSTPARYVLSPEGVPIGLFWQPSTNEWLRVPSFTEGCWRYNRCGRNAVCVGNETAATATPSCQCLRGFIPSSMQDWDKGDHSRGCTRRVPLPGNRDEEGFLRIERTKLADGFRLVVNATEKQCYEECLLNSSCTAYSYSNASVMMSSSRCLVWAGDLIDLANYKFDSINVGFAALRSDIYIRLAAIELDSQQTNNSSSKRPTLLAVVISVTLMGMLLLVVLVCILTRRLRGRRELGLLDDLNMPNILGNEEHPSTLKLLDFSVLQAATNNFSTENRLGEGGFGPVYKGELPGGQLIAIKKLSKCSDQGFEEFRNEVEVIARLQHTNLVRLLGWCIYNNEKILVYEYMSNKSLDKFLFDPTRKEELTWPRRFNIIQGVAQGLLYLHRYSRLRIIHRDIKASNILLDEEMNPKISDFGLARIFGNKQTEGNTNRVVGTIGYMSPEYAFDGLFSEKSDVFAFGVIILEIVTGKRSTGCYLYKESLNLLGYVWEHWKEQKALDLLDSSLGSDLSTRNIEKCIQIGLLCTQDRAVDRPTMSSVVSMLDIENAILPSPNQPAFSTQKYFDFIDSQSSVFCFSNSLSTHHVMVSEANTSS